MKYVYRSAFIILLIAFTISQWTVVIQRKTINMYKDYVDVIHENWMIQKDSTGWHKEIFIIPEN